MSPCPSGAERDAFSGLALAIIRPRTGAGGSISLRVESDGLDGAELRLEAIAPLRH